MHMNSSRGTFIVIEGGDGAGKDTQTALLKEKLGTDRVRFVKDPGTTDIGLRLRDLLIHEKEMSLNTELLVQMATRTQLVDECIRPALERGTHVVSNRFLLSTIAYQIYGRERHDALSLVRTIAEYAFPDVPVDLLVFLDCPPGEGLRRIQNKALDKFESEELAFHERVRDGYRAHISDYAAHHVIIDAARSREDVHADVMGAVAPLLTE